MKDLHDSWDERQHSQYDERQQKVNKLLTQALMMDKQTLTNLEFLSQEVL